jgi:Asp-tRNA(Asn)/Glu-tRNA(Gln) amidotransferase A subunit family amidase
VGDIVERGCALLDDAGAVVDVADPVVGDIAPAIATLRAFSLAIGPGGDVPNVDNPFAREFFERARRVTVEDVSRAIAEQSRYVEGMAAFFDSHDVLITPTTPTPAWFVRDMFPSIVDGEAVNDPIQAMMLTYAVTFAQLPAVSVPAGFTAGGLPVGMQIVGGRHQDALVLRTAAAFEQLSPWSDMVPPVIIDS